MRLAQSWPSRIGTRPSDWNRVKYAALTVIGWLEVEQSVAMVSTANEIRMQLAECIAGHPRHIVCYSAESKYVNR